MRSRGIRGLTIAVAVLTSAIVVVGIAVAKPHRNDAHYPATLVIDHYVDGDAGQQPPAIYGFYGFIKSPRQLCEQRRLVELLVVNPETHAKTIVGTGKTDVHGNWHIQYDADGERYFARTHTEKVVPRGGNDHIICEDDNTPRQTIGTQPGGGGGGG
ncbi:MAG: hypothetical protein QOG09_999 [Solirubrobacterales bacterium]|nr:hypothetical protein [Solirubrobacterales bacterium]